MENLIYLKKKMYYLLLNMPNKDITWSEVRLLADLENDIELQAEICYTEYMKGEQR